jgi:putative transposase
MTEELRFQGKILGAVISRTADWWFAAIQVEMPDVKPIHTTISENQAVGVDLGINSLAALSNGEKITGAKPHAKLLARERRLNKRLSRKKGSVKGEVKSKNFIKSQIKLSRLHAKIKNIRNDQTHKLTSSLAKNYSIIGIEDLNISGMAQNRHIARTLLDMSFYEFRRQLVYKSKMTGSRLVIAERFYPSSKTCSHCGYKQDELPLSIRKWQCPVCKVYHDRDVNAAVNLKKYAVSYTVSACGELVDAIASKKQEFEIAVG